MALSAAERRKQYREEIKKQQEDSFARRDVGGKFKTIFNEEAPTDNFWKCGEAKHEINIIPFTAGSQHPTKKEGAGAYMVDVWRHDKIGPNENSYICLNLTYDRACPLCEEQARLKKNDAPDVEVKALNAKHRVIYNIQVLDNNKEKDKGIQIWDAPYHSFERLLVERAEEKKGGKVYFASPDDGKLISFKRKGMGPTNTEYLNIDFEEREEPISDELLDEAYQLDMILHIPTYDEVKSAYFGTSTKEESKPEKTKKEEPQKEDPPDVDDPNDCPYNYEFGVDYDEKNECDDCDSRRDCKLANRELGKKEDPEPEPEPEKEESPRSRRSRR